MNQLIVISENLATAGQKLSAWMHSPDLPYFVGTAGSSKVVTVIIEQSHDASTVAYSDSISNIPGNSTIAENTVAGFRLSRVAPFVRINFSNTSGETSSIKANVYGSI